MKPSKSLALLALACTLLTGCNAGAIALGYVSQRILEPATISGNLSATNGTVPAAAKVGEFAWVEVLGDNSVKGKNNFDLVANKNVDYDQTTLPGANHYSLEIKPGDNVLDGIYVLMCWDDANGNNKYDGDLGEKRAQEVYRVHGQIALRSLWSVEKFVFTDTKLSVEYAQQDQLHFVFQ